MPFFKFKAEKQNGDAYEGMREAPDKFTLYSDLRREGDTVVSTEEVKKKKSGGFSIPFLNSLLVGVSMHDRILLARNLGNMLEAGLSLGRALSVIERQTTKKGLKTVVQKIESEINRGQQLSESLKLFPNVFSKLFVSMVRAGEESGSLPSSLKSVSVQMMNTYTLQKKIRGAMIYPAIIICVIIVIATLMLVYVVPTLTATFAELDVELPLNTRIVIGLSDFIQNNTLLAFAIFASFAGGLVWFRKKPFGKRFIDKMLLRIPVIKTLVRESNSARTARTLSSLLSSGVEVVQAIEITTDVVPHTLFKEVLDSAKQKVTKGETLSAVFGERPDLYPVFVAEMISIGEETGKLGEMLSNVADYYEEEVAQKTKDLSTIIEPALMIVVGIAVGFFALSMLQPMYSLVDVI